MNFCIFAFKKCRNIEKMKDRGAILKHDEIPAQHIFAISPPSLLGPCRKTPAPANKDRKFSQHLPIIDDAAPRHHHRWITSAGWQARVEAGFTSSVVLKTCGTIGRHQPGEEPIVYRYHIGYRQVHQWHRHGCTRTKVLLLVLLPVQPVGTSSVTSGQRGRR